MPAPPNVLLVLPLCRLWADSILPSVFRFFGRDDLLFLISLLLLLLLEVVCELRRGFRRAVTSLRLFKKFFISFLFFRIRFFFL